MNALSGLDPKYIDEAAFELHGKTVSFADAKKARARKNLLIALPAAAAAFILIGVMLIVPTMRKLTTSESAAPAASDAAAVAPAESAAEAPAYAEEAASDAAPAYEAEEAAEPVGAYEEAAEAAGETPKSAENAAEEAAVQEPAESAAEEAAPAQGPLGLKRATWFEGRLIVRTEGAVPDDISEFGYAVKGMDEKGNETVYAKGLLGDVLKKEDPLTLDLTDLALEEGTYTLEIGEEEIEFTI